MGNALAFEKAGITAKSLPEKGGKILLDKKGELKFVLINGAKRLLLDKIPEKSLEQQTRIMILKGSPINSMDCLILIMHFSSHPLIIRIALKKY